MGLNPTIYQNVKQILSTPCHHSLVPYEVTGLYMVITNTSVNMKLRTETTYFHQASIILHDVAMVDSQYIHYTFHDT